MAKSKKLWGSVNQEYESKGSVEALSPDKESRLRCEIQDLRQELRYALMFWEMNIEASEEGGLDEETRRRSRLIIKEVRKEYGLE